MTSFDDVTAQGPSEPGPSEPGPSEPDPPRAAHIVLAAERLQTATEWAESGRIRLRRRIVSETRMIEVLVQREELLIETRDASPGVVGESYRGTSLDGDVVAAPLAASDGAPLIVSLREQVPEIVMRARVYERVHVDVVVVDEVAVRHDTLRHERVQAETSD